MRFKIVSMLLIFLIASCSVDENGFIVQSENQYEIINGKNILVGQVIRTLRISDSLPVAVLTKVSNYQNDTRIQYMTGLTEKDGIQNYLLDSLYYDETGNDTLKKSFVHQNKKWQPTQIFYKKFGKYNRVTYFMTERPYKKDRYSKKEIFYSYNSDGNIATQTEFECLTITDCDSVFKERYIYDPTGEVDSTVSYIWENNEWVEFRVKNSR